MTAAAVQARAATLAAAFDEVERTRMAGVPLLHPRLHVQALGFQLDDGDPSVALGVLVTPWFMNLVRLPLDASAEQALAAVGQRRMREVGMLEVDFLGAYEAAFGRFETCSLFSPMTAFVDQDGALAVARQVLAQLRTPAAAARPMENPKAAAPGRRAFLFGRAANDRCRP